MGMFDFFKSEEEKKKEKSKEVATKFVMYAAQVSGGYFGVICNSAAFIIDLPSILENEGDKYSSQEIAQYVVELPNQLSRIAYFMESPEAVYCAKLKDDQEFCTALMNNVDEFTAQSFRGAMITYLEICDYFPGVFERMAKSLKAANLVAEKKAQENPDSEILKKISAALCNFRSDDPSDFIIYCRNAFHNN